jgi:hypothetical protein
LGAGSTAPCITPSSQKIDQLPFSLVQLDVGIQKGVLCEWHAEEEVDLHQKNKPRNAVYIEEKKNLVPGMVRNLNSELQRKIKMCILGKLNTHFLRFSFH